MFDFCQKLAKHPEYLDVCGDGKQTKPYLHIDDCISGILHVIANANGSKEPAIFNIAPSDGTSVDFIAKQCVAASNNPNAEIQYTGGEQGWKGDIPISRLSPLKLASLGFAVSMTSDQAAKQAIHEIAEDVFGRR